MAADASPVPQRQRWYATLIYHLSPRKILLPMPCLAHFLLSTSQCLQPPHPHGQARRTSIACIRVWPSTKFNLLVLSMRARHHGYLSSTSLRQDHQGGSGKNWPIDSRGLQLFRKPPSSPPAARPSDTCPVSPSSLSRHRSTTSISKSTRPRSTRS